MEDVLSTSTFFHNWDPRHVAHSEIGHFHDVYLRPNLVKFIICKLSLLSEYLHNAKSILLLNQILKMSLQAWNESFAKLSTIPLKETYRDRASYGTRKREGKNPVRNWWNRWTLHAGTIVKTFNWSTIIKISSWVRSEPVTWGIHAIPVLPADLAPSWNYAQEFEEDREGGERKRRAGMQRHDGRRFYHPVEFIKKIRCSRRQHLIRCHAQRREILLPRPSLPFPQIHPLFRLPLTILLHLPHWLSHFTPFVLNGFDRGRQKPKLARFSRELY